MMYPTELLASPGLQMSSSVIELESVTDQGT
ncbi:hypothetical protein Cha6605_4174 [Chamaesiphon minutus PCC 6605]|uniref:Uncharacterized protein n=1 Tax=Chamaesiphon minutus (strain ATCC 27169 / PCC 6605) TaxID=1173020 RepID=K9ULN9_CHAP6|nr:hypothetical protein Cha6605_4174 [Chamaesiphon minutus PCC 6605]